MSEADGQENTALEETQYALEPTTFHSMQEAQELAGILEEKPPGPGHGRRQRAPRTRGGVLRASQQRRRARDDGGGRSRPRPLRAPPRSRAFDMAAADSGPGIRATLEENPEIPRPETDAGAIGLAVQELVSGTRTPHPGHRPVDDRHRDEKAGPEAVGPLGLRPPHHVRRRRARAAGNGAQAGRHGETHHPRLSRTAPREP